MEDRQLRIFLALFLSLGIWLFLQYIFFPPQEKSKPKTNTVQEDTLLKPDTIDKTVPEEKSKILTPTVNPKEIRYFYIETAPYLIKISSLGARIEEFYIRNHPEPDGTELKILKDPSKHKILFNDKEFIAIEISRGKGFDFNPIWDKDTIPNSFLNSIHFNCRNQESEYLISCKAPIPNSKAILTKNYHFYPKENYFRFELIIENPTNEKIYLATNQQPLFFRSFGSLGPLVKPEKEMTDRDYANFFRYFYIDGTFSDYLDGTSTEGFFSKWFGGTKLEDPRFDIRKSNSTEAVDFAGTGSRYFIAVLDPLNYNPEGVLLDNRTGNETGVLLVYKNIELNPNDTLQYNYAAYVGVREPEGMAFRDSELDPFKNQRSPFKGLSSALDKSFNQGITTPFRNGIVWLLKKIYIVVPNYGWAIVIFAILFKLVFFPLNQKQAESMKKMQELSPQIKEISEKYANDPQTKQMKIMELYKKHKVNPMGGCLPMLIQIPIFIALYTAFSDAVDLWESSFLWVKDLSEPDTVFVIPLGSWNFHLNLLPLIMVVTQVIQTRMTVVSGDPNQKLMMYIMPVIMLYFFWSMPSGVTLYWTCQNILSILQQFYTNNFGKEAKEKKEKEKPTQASNTNGSKLDNKPKLPGRREPQFRKRRKK